MSTTSLGTLSFSALRRGSRAAVLLVLVVAALLGPTAPASAHDRVLSTSPGDGSHLDVGPSTIEVLFNNDLLLLGDAVSVTAPDGTRVAMPPSEVAGPLLRARPPRLEIPGTYVVLYRAVSSDGHPVTGRFTFTVGQVPASAASQPGAGTSTSGPSVGVLAGVSGLAAVAILVILAGRGRRRRRALSE